MLAQVMDKTLSKLATFDEGSMMGSVLGFVVSIFIFCGIPVKLNSRILI